MDDSGFADFVKSHGWTFSKSMPQWPHWYVVRRDCRDDSEFEDAVVFIRDEGFWCKWQYGPGKIYLPFDGHYYWTMGAPIDETIIINRCRMEDYVIKDRVMCVRKDIDGDSIQRKKRVRRRSGQD